MKLLFYILLLTLTSCNSLTPEERVIKKSLGKYVETEMFSYVHEDNSVIPYKEFRSKYDYISLVYLADGCSSCYSRYVEWQNGMDTLNYIDEYTVLFIIEGMSYSIFISNLKKNIPEYDLDRDRFYLIMDSDKQFLNANIKIPQQIINKSILIDINNRIRLIGDPFANPQMAEIFYRICNAKEK